MIGAEETAELEETWGGYSALSNEKARYLYQCALVEETELWETG